MYFLGLIWFLRVYHLIGHLLFVHAPVLGHPECILVININIYLFFLEFSLLINLPSCIFARRGPSALRSTYNLREGTAK